MSPRRKTENKPAKLEIPVVSDHPGRSIPLLLISLAGLIVSIVSGFHERIPFLASLCSSACRDTPELHFFHMPVWLLGALFYCAAAVLALYRRPTVTWIAAPAAGVEAVLILVLVQLKEPCVFCVANAVAVLLLVAASFRKELFWQQATLALLFFVGAFFWVPFENGPAPRSAKGAAHVPAGDQSDIAAIVGDEVITEQRLDVLLGPRLLETRRDIYRMKMERLEQIILETILDREAKKQGKTPEQLVEQIAPAASTPVEESEIDKYMQDNQERLKAFQGNVPDLRVRIRAFLEQQKRSQVIKEYIHALEPQYGVRILVPVPNPPKVKVDTRGCPTLGPADAPVTVVELSDYQCPACRSTHLVVKEVRAAYGNKVQWIYKDYPLKRHQEAFKAAEAAHCAEDQGKFWEYQEMLFAAPDLTPDSLVNLAVQLGMSKEKFSQCLQDSTYSALVSKNIRDAVLAGVDRTPTFMINGTVYVGGPSLEAFRGLIDEELKKTGVEKRLGMRN